MEFGIIKTDDGKDSSFDFGYDYDYHAGGNLNMKKFPLSILKNELLMAGYNISSVAHTIDDDGYLIGESTNVDLFEYTPNPNEDLSITIYWS